jgi:tetratricopeptide (TPR) repeat protein
VNDLDATATGLHAHDDLPPGTVLGDRYRIDGLLGVGGMGVVHRATDLTLQVPVALKLLRPELAHRGDAFERFRQELLLARQVSSPRVVRIHDLARHDGRWLISMDLVDGEGLDRRLDREGPLPVEDAVRIARQIAEGLAAAHAQGVVHRDLKPANILLDRDGDARISDFGVARSLATSGGTRTGSVVGTPDYLSPEQARGDTVDARSDLYALGLILHEMLAGALPFPGGTFAEAVAQRMLRAPTPVTDARPDTPGWLARLVARLLRQRPAHRPQSAEAVVDILSRRALPRDARDAWSGARRSRLAWTAAGALLLAAGTGAWWLLSSRAPDPAVAAVVPAPAALDRLLVLPLRGEGIVVDPVRDAALTAHLHDALSTVPGLAVVDAERTRQALRVRDPGGQAVPDPLKLAVTAAARRVLETRWVDAPGGGVRLRARLLAIGQPAVVIDGPAVADPIAALRAWMSAPATAAALGAPARMPALKLPPAAALAAYGEGLRARDDGRLDIAAARFEAAVAAAPDDAASWIALARVALDAGERRKAADAIVQAQRSADPAMAPRLSALRATIEDDPAAVVQWAALSRATPGDTAVALQWARAQAGAGEVDAAAAALQALAARDPDDPRVWFERGKLAILRGNARIAVDDHLVRALVAFKRGRDAYGEAETVNALGVGYGRLGQTADAAEQYRRAITLRRALGNRRGLATSLRNLANVLSLTGDYAGADRALREAGGINVEIGDREAQAAVDNERGLLAEERGDHRAALEAFKRALRTWQDMDDRHGAADALNNIGFAHYQLGGYGDAEVYWRQAADAYDALGERTGRVRTQQNLGLLATARGRWREARRSLEDALRESEQQQMLEEAAVSRRNLAELELQQGHARAAIEQAGKAEAAFRQREDLRGVSDAGLLRAEALLAAGDQAGAMRVLDALAPDIAAASTEQQGIAAWLHARIAAMRGDQGAYADHLRRARTLAEASGVRLLQLRVALLAARDRADALAALDAPTAALGHVGLRMDWLAQTLSAAVARGDASAARATYDEVLSRTRAGDVAHAEALHRLGARARSLAGDQAGARAALARADEAARVAASPPAIAGTGTTMR